MSSQSGATARLGATAASAGTNGADDGTGADRARDRKAARPAEPESLDPGPTERVDGVCRTSGLAAVCLADATRPEARSVRISGTPGVNHYRARRIVCVSIVAGPEGVRPSLDQDRPLIWAKFD